MGAKNGKWAFTMYPDLPDQAMRALVGMALTAFDDHVDGQPPRIFWGGRVSIAELLGREVPKAPEPDDESAAARKARHDRALAFQAVRDVGRTLKKAGAVTVIRHGRAGVNTEYKLWLDPLEGKAPGAEGEADSPPQGEADSPPQGEADSPPRGEADSPPKEHTGPTAGIQTGAQPPLAHLTPDRARAQRLERIALDESRRKLRLVARDLGLSVPLDELLALALEIEPADPVQGASRVHAAAAVGSLAGARDPVAALRARIDVRSVPMPPAAASARLPA